MTFLEYLWWKYSERTLGVKHSWASTIHHTFIDMHLIVSQINPTQFRKHFLAFEGPWWNLGATKGYFGVVPLIVPYVIQELWTSPYYQIFWIYEEKKWLLLFFQNFLKVLKKTENWIKFFSNKIFKNIK